MKRRGIKAKKTERSMATTDAPGAPVASVFEYTPEFMEDCFYQAMDLLRSKGVDVDNHPFWGQFKNDPTFRTEQIAEVISEINDHNDKAIRALSEFKDVSFGTPISRDEYLKLRKRTPRKESNSYERLKKRTLDKFSNSIRVIKILIPLCQVERPNLESVNSVGEQSGASLNKR